MCVCVCVCVRECVCVCVCVCVSLSSSGCIVGVIFVYVDTVYGFYGYSFLCLVGCFSMVIWTPTVLSVLYACVLYFYIWTCSAQLSMFRSCQTPVGVWSNHLGTVPETADRQAGAYIARNMIRSTRGNSLKLLKPRHCLNVRGNYFANRVVNLRNSHPDNVITAPSVDSFKRRLDKHWAALPSMYDPECLA